MKELIILLQSYYNNQFLSRKQIFDIIKCISKFIPIKYLMVCTQPKKYIDINYLGDTYTITFKKDVIE